MKLSRRRFMAGASCSAMLLDVRTAGAGLRLHGSASAAAPFSFQQIKVGGGGFMRMVDISPDGTTVLCNSDVCGCWLLDIPTNTWHDLLNTSHGFTVSNPGNYAAYGMASAPSQPTTIYMYVNDGFLYRSLDRGASFVKLTQFTQKVSGTNNGGGLERFYGPRLAVDPINPDVVIICTEANGVWVTTNGTAGTGATPTFSQITGLAAATDPAGCVVCFDTGGGSGSTNIAYIGVNGTGVYQRTTPAGAFSLLSSGVTVPGGISHMMVAPTTGILYLCDLTANLHKFTAGAWALTTAPGVNPFAVAIDPASSGTRLVVCDQNANLSVSTNSGGAWSLLTETTPGLSPDIPWLIQTGNSPRAAGNIVFDPSSNLKLSDGIGIWTCAIPSTGSFQWTTQTKGIENLQTNGILISPSATGTPCGYAWDRSIIYMSNPNTYSATQGPYTTYLPAPLEITMVWGMDWASSDKNTLVSMGFWEAPFLDMGATSTNNGATWTLNPPQSDAFFTVTTNAATLAGGNTLSFAPGTFTTPTSYLMQIANLTNPTSIPAGTYLIGNTGGNTLHLNNTIAAPGVGSGDTITLKYASSPFLRVLKTNAATASGSVLHFGAGNVPSYIQMGMFTFDETDNTKLVSGGAPAQVLSVNYSTGDVTLNQPVINGGPASGDFIFFYWEKGGSIAAASPTNWIVCLGQDASFPSVTTDGGATWSSIDIPGVPRMGTGVVTNTSTTVSGLSFTTADLVVGQTFNNSYNSFSSISGGANGTSISGIISSTSFTAGVAANTTPAISPDLILPFTGWGHSDFGNLKLAAADRFAANTFYLYNYLTGLVYTSTASGANGTWSPANRVEFNGNVTIAGGVLTVNSTVSGALAVGHMIAGTGIFGNPRITSPAGAGTWNLNFSHPNVGPVAITSRVNLAATYGISGGSNLALKSVPYLGGTNTQGHLFLTNANISANPTNAFVRSTDGGATWAAVSCAQGSVLGVGAFGFGAAKPAGGGYPAIYIWGVVGGIQGTWRSDDNCANFVQLGSDAYPMGTVQGVSDMDGDKITYGKFYFSLGENGWGQFG